MAERIPVLIVGAGPVGLALAGDLGWRGVPCLLLAFYPPGGTQVRPGRREPWGAS